jgi:hydrogenase nickel incorporation protein HypB
MCQTCGCGDPQLVPIEIEDRILAANDVRARHNREQLGNHGVLALNLMGSPGSGKTAVLEAVAHAFAGRRRLVAIAGDLATDLDAERLRAAGVPSVGIQTGSACHLDAELVHRAVHGWTWGRPDYLFIENVGNLVCPAVYDLGQHANIVALSVTEGEDKPLKYPVIFHRADLVLITKLDLLPHLPGVQLRRIEDGLARVIPEPRVIALSAVTGWGVDAFVAWLEERRLARSGGRALTPVSSVGV